MLVMVVICAGCGDGGGDNNGGSNGGDGDVGLVMTMLVKIVGGDCFW